jgi:molecular chaperone IbpA
MTNFQKDLFFGFDDLFNSLNNSTATQQSYPPYNVIKKGENHYFIEIAVAGFKSSDIDLTLDKGILTVTGNMETNPKTDYVHKGISTRNFTRAFTLADTIEVVGADVVDGLLLIGLENKIPEEDKPQTINLGEFSKKAKELLLG